MPVSFFQAMPAVNEKIPPKNKALMPIPALLQQKQRPKLEKYFSIACDHHAYILDTSKSHFYLELAIAEYSSLVLHPALHSQWFCSTADLNDPTGQQAAVDKAETIFCYVAHTYLAMPSQESNTTISAAVTEPTINMPSFLASMCSFQMPAVSAQAASQSPAEELELEIRQYLAFHGEALPLTEEEQIACLMDPLSSWKVCIPCAAQENGLLLSNNIPHVSGPSCYSRHQCIS